MPYFGNNPSPLLLNTVAQNGKEMTLDADADTSITADTDDQIDIKIGGSDIFQLTASKLDINGKELVLDADADTSITADTDDQIDIRIGGADDFQFTANTFTAQSGSTIAAQALTATTITASGVLDITDTTDSSDATGDTGALRTEGGASIAKKLYVGTDLDVDGTANLDVVDIDGNVDIAGDVTFNGDNYNLVWDKSDDALEFGDNAKANFGAGNDLQIYHDGNHSRIVDSGTGYLVLQSSRVQINNAANSENIAAFAEDGAVELYYDNSKKLETTTNGIVVGGTTAESFNTSMSSLQIGRGAIQQWNPSGGATYLTSNLFYSTSDNWEYIGTGGGNVLSLNNGTLYYYRIASGSDGGTATLTESFRSDANGSFFVFSSHNGNVACTVQNSASTPYGIESKFNSVSPDNNTSWAYNFTDSTAAKFRVYSDGDVVNHDNSYGSISDERIKQDIVDANSQWDDIKAVKVRNYKKKDDIAQYGDKAWTQIGVIAQELETVSPKLIKEATPDASDIKHSAEFGTLYEDGDTIPEGKEVGDVKEIKANVKKVSYSILYMKAVKALQEAMARIETLEAKVKTLEEA